MKRIILSLALLAGISTTASAQFSKGTKYVNANFTGLGLGYSKDSDFKFGLNVAGGYYFANDWMVDGEFGYQRSHQTNNFILGAGVRYNITQNGLYLGTGAELEFYNISGIDESSTTNFRIPVEIGYTFFVNHYVSIEPAVYAKMSCNNFSDGTEFGLKIGLGLYFDNLKAIFQK